jgi:hypothetical protein
VALVAWIAHSTVGSALVRVLAEGEGPKDANIWNPTIIGILTILCAIGLFCGSAYLLLGTNLGGRLGFLVAAAGLTGFLLLLTTLWWTSGSSGIDPPHGRSPQWRVIDVVDNPADSKIAAVRDIAANGERIPVDKLTNLKPAIDAAIVPAQSLTGETPAARPFATLGFTSSTEYLVDAVNLRPYGQGGGTKNIFWHEQQYAAVELCTALPDAAPPKCDPLKGTKYVILSHDLGTLRQPVVAYWFISLLLFGLSLLGLHWYEKDQRSRQQTGLTTVPSPGS